MIIVPYCSTCHNHASAAPTRVLALSLAALLLAVSAAVAVPLLWEWVSAPVYMLCVLAAAGLPAALGQVVPAGPGTYPHAPGRAAWWARDGTLTCTNAAWAVRLADVNGMHAQSARVRERLWSPWMLSAIVVSAVAAPFWFSYRRADVRVLNLTDTRLVLNADGRRLAIVEPSSTESPAAGADVRIPAGHRRLAVHTQDGRLVQQTSAFIQAGRQHLYAPASPTYCFWLEATKYQDAAVAPTHVEPLVSADRFWVLPTDIDTWLAPNPPAASLGVRSTGGILVALRQARCTDAPATDAPPSLGRKPN